MSKLLNLDSTINISPGTLLTYCQDSFNLTGWVPAIYLGYEGRVAWGCVKCIVVKNDRFEIKDIHYTRLDTEMLDFDYKRTPLDARSPL